MYLQSHKVSNPLDNSVGGGALVQQQTPGLLGSKSQPYCCVATRVDALVCCPSISNACRSFLTERSIHLGLINGTLTFARDCAAALQAHLLLLQAVG